MTRARRSSALFAAALLALGACSGGGDGTAAPGSNSVAAGPAPAATAPATGATPELTGEAAKIAALTRHVFLAEKVGDICRTKLSARFVMDMFGTVRSCERNWESEDDPEDRPTGMDVSDIQINGLAATAKVTAYDDSQRVHGTWALIRSGEDWRIAAWGADFLRSMLIFGVLDSESEEPDDVFDEPGVRTCLIRRITNLEDDSVNALWFGMMRDDKRAQRRLQSLLMACANIPDETGVTALRRAYEQGARKTAANSGIPQVADCVVERLRETVTDDELLDAMSKMKDVYPQALKRPLQRAAFECTLEQQGATTA